ncbi:unnamed protein product [Amaranthus hypochondriacus]
MKDVTNIAELRAKLTTPSPRDKEAAKVECDPPNNSQRQMPMLSSNPEETKEEEWTPVAPGKIARRHLNRVTKSTTTYTAQVAKNLSMEEIEDGEDMAAGSHQRGGIPENPFDQ